MKKTMKAAVLRKIGTKLAIENLPIPEPQRGEILIKVAACGVCHSDLHAVDGDWTPGPVLPLIPGHEVAGHVAALGGGDPKEGTRILCESIEAVRKQVADYRKKLPRPSE